MAVSGGGGVVGKLVRGPIVFWVGGTFLLALVSRPLAADFSELVSSAYGATLGIISSDGPNIGDSFDEGQAAAGGAPAADDTAKEAQEAQEAKAGAGD